MHELGLCADIVAAVERRAGNRPVAALTVRVGRLHHVQPGAFEQSFAMAAEGSVAEGARVDLVLLPVRSLCAACGRTTDSEELLAACPACGAVDVAPVGGDELILESIEYLPSGAAPAGTSP
jgi:hydrogenase nickel incorporation protein HypA/HybF